MVTRGNGATKSAEENRGKSCCYHGSWARLTVFVLGMEGKKVGVANFVFFILGVFYEHRTP